MLLKLDVFGLFCIIIAFYDMPIIYRAQENMEHIPFGDCDETEHKKAIFLRKIPFLWDTISLCGTFIAKVNQIHAGKLKR